MNHLRYIPRTARRVPILTEQSGFWNVLAIGVIAIVYAIFALAMIIYSATLARSQDNHELHHAQYFEWKSNEGFSCCNNDDCGTLPDSRMRESGGHIEVLVFDEIQGDEWCPVEERHLIDQTRGKRQSPDWSKDHACIVKAASGGTCEKLKCFMEKGKF